MPLYSTAGCQISIGGIKSDQAADFVEADFDGETWVPIDGWTSMGGIGDTAQVITTSLINRGRDVKQKGTSNAGSMQNVFADVPGDAGQAALRSAALPSDKNNYAFKVEFNDADPAAGSTPTTLYFIGLVMSAMYNGGGANTIREINGTIEINSNIVIVDPVAGP